METANYKKKDREMNDTHGVEGRGWYGFDLDGVLAVYTVWKGIDHIGAPVKLMVDRIKRLHDEGKVVKILTARVAPRDIPEEKPNPYFKDGEPDVSDYAKAVAVGRHAGAADFYTNPVWGARYFIADWCLRNIGFLQEITHEKDHLMLELYDDRVKQVVPNEGVLVEDMVPMTFERFLFFLGAFIFGVVSAMVAILIMKL